jgi:hypothetical protein
MLRQVLVFSLSTFSLACDLDAPPDVEADGQACFKMGPSTIDMDDCTSSLSQGGQIVFGGDELGLKYEAVELTLTQEEMRAAGIDADHVIALQFEDVSAPQRPRLLPSYYWITGAQLPLVGKWVPPRTNGDAEFNGTPTQQPIWNVKAKIFICSQTKICGQIFMLAWEDDGDFSTASGWSPNFVIYPGDGRVIKQIDIPTTTVVSLSGRDTNKYAPQVIGSVGLVYEWTVYGDRSGSDAGVFTGVEADLRDIRVLY